MPDLYRNGEYRNGGPHGVNGNRTVRFGAFEADLHSGEVRKSGSRIKLQEQPFKVLQILLEHPGVLVTRDELQSRIWPAENFGDFDHAVNVAIGKLRTALGDTADNPCFIETVPRRGYRFVAKLEDFPVEAAPPVVPASSAPPSGSPAGRQARAMGIRRPSSLPRFSSDRACGSGTALPDCSRRTFSA